MALASVLMISVVLLGMAGAFFAAHKADLALMASSAYREDTKNAVLSAADFIQYRLRNDRTFSTQPFSSNRTIPANETLPESGAPQLEVSYKGNGSDTDKNVIEGHLITSKVKFEAHILNNLDNAGPGIDSWGSTPPRTARVWITAQRGNLTRHVNFIVKRSPFTNSSMLAGEDISVQLTDSDGAWWLTARQPSGNAVRAGGNINGPEVISTENIKVRFQPPGGLATRLDPPYGVMQAHSLNMQANGTVTPLNPGDELLTQAEDNTRGVLLPGSGKVNVPKLEADDLRSPANKFQMPAERLTFRSTVLGPGQIEHQLYADGNLVARYQGLDVNNRFYQWEDGGGTKAVFDLEQRTLTVPPNTELVSNGDFRLESLRPDGGLDETRQPTLILGDGVSGASSVVANKIDINGSVGGQGALKAKDGGLFLRAKSSLSTTPDFGIALHSTSDVTLAKPALASNDGLPVDWEAYKEGFSKTSGNLKNQLDGWAYLNENDQATAANRFAETDLARAGQHQDFEPIWESLTTDFPADNVAEKKRREWLQKEVPPVKGPDPNAPPPPPPEPNQAYEEPPETPEVVLTPGIPAGPGIDMDKYVRLREYLKTVKAGTPDESWLETSGGGPLVQQRKADVAALIRNQLASYQVEAGQTSVNENGIAVLKWNGLDDYFDGSNPFLASYNADMSFRGLVYAGRDFNFDTGRKGLLIEGALVAQGDIKIKDATGARFIYNSDLLENLFATDQEDTSVKLERKFWSLY